MDSDQIRTQSLETFIKEENDQQYFMSSIMQTEESSIICKEEEFLKYKEEHLDESTAIEYGYSKCNTANKQEKTEEIIVNIENVISDTPEKESDLCPFKSESIDRPNMLLKDTAFQCKLGDKNSEEKRFPKHMVSHTSEITKNIEHDKYAFGSSEMKPHTRRKMKDKPFVCVKCNKCFFLLSELTKHNKTHTEDNPFKCEKCGKCFTCTYGLTRHKRTHPGEKPFKCQECGKFFSSSSGLSQHSSIHTGEKAFKCEQCGKGFSSSSGLTRHNRIHKGERFICEQCGKSFSYSNSLRRHRSIHT